MSWLEANIFGGLNKLKNSAWSMAFLILVTTMSAAPRSSAQAMKKGISVELAPTSSAVPVPDADAQNALIITVTDGGELYFGIDPVVPDSLMEKLKERVSHRTQNLYIKADAKAPYASVVKVLDAARTADVVDVTLLTAQPTTKKAGTAVLPEGIEMELAPRSPAVTK
jgi:biopolymer transport protein ExbD